MTERVKINLEALGNGEPKRMPKSMNVFNGICLNLENILELMCEVEITQENEVVLITIWDELVELQKYCEHMMFEDFSDN